jgi:hypothetical protein
MIDIYVTDNGLGDRGIVVRLPAGSRDLLSSENVRIIWGFLLFPSG